MNEEESIFGTEPERLMRLMRSGMEKDESDVEKNTGQTAPAGSITEQPGTQIGRYKLLRTLGEGGMGIVYLAEQQGSIRRRVALKVIKPGMDSKRVIARFEVERQALALLDHLNIANVYDAGTTEAGRPYFVMEYVKGLPITEYCDHHKLTIEERLRLFQQVCHAVHHAHQKGIIHRDIKPSNILVSTQDDQAVPKIIDFGVAKAISRPLTERTLVTEDSQLLGTPEYMSPEQADMAGEDIDIRSDIYSLGVLLYVLLTGVLPFDSDTLRTGGIEHIRRIIRETDPKTPSTRLTKLGEEARKVAEKRRTEVATLAKCLHRELEWIPLKAMRKERAERYRSASEFADDIDNYLKGAPLVAGPPGSMYRLKKFTQRNRTLVSGVIAVSSVLIVGFIVSTVLYIRAESASAEALMIADFLKADVLSSARRIKGRDATVLDILDASAQSIEDRFADEPLVEASIRETLGKIYWDLGYYKASVLHRERAYLIYLEQLGKEHGATTNAMNWLAVSYNFTGKYREAEELWKRLTQKDDRIRPGYKCNLAVSYARQGRYKEAERLLKETLETAGWGPDYFMTLLYSWDLAKIYREQGLYEKAEELFVKTLNAQRHKYGDKGDENNRMMIRCMNELALLYVIQGCDKEAEDLFTEGIALGESELPGKDHPFTLRHVNGLGVLRTKQGRYDDAVTLFNRALAGRRLKLGEDHPETLETINDIGVLYMGQGRYEEAEKYLREAVEGRCLKLGDTHPHTLESWNNLINLYEAWNKPEQAEKWRLQLPSGSPNLKS